MKYTALILLSAFALANTEDGGKYPNGCPLDWSVEQLLPHPDCRKFFQCWDGQLVEHSCPAHLYFSVEANRCEWSEVIDCSATYVPDKESDEADNSNGDNDNNPGHGDSDNDNQVVGGGNCDPSQAPEICAAEGSESVLVAHEKCNKYYICHNGVPVPRRCQAGLFFNPLTDRCDWPENVDCGDRVIPDGGSGGNGNGDNNGNNPGIGSNENGGDDNGNGGNDNQVVGGGNCDPSQAPGICAAEGSDSVLVAHEKCNKYYICHNGVPVPRRCQAGLFFNPLTDRCDWPENVDCGDRVIPDGGSGGNGNGDSNGNNPEIGSNENGGDDNGNGENDNQVVGGGNCDPSQAPEICAAEGSDSVLVAHEKCNKYYICHNGVPVPRRCQAGLFFNPLTDRCDWPENMDCGDRVIPDGGSGGNGNGDNNGNNPGIGSNENGGSDGGNGENDNQVVGGGNCDPSQAPEICAAEGSDSVLVAHEKCNKYYICHNGVPVPRRCQAGLFFNPLTDRCDWPENVDCGDRVIPDGGSGGNGNGDNNGNNPGIGSNENGGSDGGNGGNDNQVVGGGNCDPSQAPKICAAEDSDSVLVAHEKCNKYYICHNGVPVPRLCQAGLFFNPLTDRCDWPENVDCGDRVIPDGGSGGNGNGDNNGNNPGIGSNENGGSDGGNGGNDNQVVGGGNCDPSQAPKICAAEDSDSVLVAHEKCNKYYICHNGVPVPRLCQAGLFFNPLTDRCDWPENVDCGDRVIPDGGSGGNGNGDNNGNNPGIGSNENGGSDGGNGGNDNQVVGGGNCDPSQAPKICAAEDSDSVLVAHEKCNKYYICYNGVPVSRRCPVGLFFNPLTDRCDWPENVDCGDRVIPDGGSGGNGNGDNNGNNPGIGSNENGGSDGGNGGNDNQIVGGGNCDPSQAPKICAAEDSDSVLVAHEKCNKYYICHNGVPVPRLCQAGLFFNPLTDRCDWPENVDCGDRVIPDGGSGGNGNGDNNGNNPEIGSNENGDDDNGNGGNDDQVVGGGNCDPSQAPEICAAEGSDSVLVAHEKCNKYYICHNGVPVPRRCQAGLFFNPLTDRCDWPENVDCGDRVIPDGDSGGTGNGDSDNIPGNGEDNNGGSDSDNGGNDNQVVGGGNCDPSQAPKICAAEDSDSVLVAHEKCNKYYICHNGVPVPRRCQVGLFFNPLTDRCDWPENVDCGDRVIPDGGSGGNGNGDSNGNNPEIGSNENGGDDNGNGENDNQVVGGGNCDPSQAPEICAAEGSDSVLVAHEKCNKYYICHNGVPVPRRCQAGLFFNPLTDRCDWPENVDCGDRVITDGGSSGNGNGDNNGNNPGIGSNENGGSDGGNGGNDNQVVGGGNCDPSQAPKICAAEDSDSVLVAHEKCNKYYICHNGVPVPRRCQAGLFFNPLTDRCDWPENVDCGDRVIPDGGSGGNGNGDNNGNNPGIGSNENGGDDNGNGGNDNQVVGGGNCDPSQAPEICAAEGSESVLVAHEKCNKYYICHNGVPVPRRCQADLFFNPLTDRCDWPENVDCGDRVIPDGGSGGNGNGDNNGNNPGIGSNENGGDDNGNGGNDNQVVGGGNCDPSQAPEICAAEGSESVLVAHEKCNKYYICHNGVPVPRRCQAGLFFNPLTDRCDWPENVDCGDRVIPDGGSGGNGNGDNNGNNPGIGSNENGGSDSGNGGNDNQVIGGGNCDPSQAPEICAAEGSESVLIAHEKCNKYYICVHGVPVPRPCSAGLFFNPNTDQCDWLENVDCGDRVIPDDDSGNNGNGDGDNNGNGDNGNGGSDNGGSDNDNQNVGECNCNPNEAAEICATEGSDSVLVAHEKCNKYFICSHGKPITQRCSTGLLYNPYKEQCDWPHNVDCGDRLIPDGDNNNENGNSNENSGNGDDGIGGSDNGGSDNGGSDNDNQNVGQCNCNPNEAPEICAVDGSNNVLVAHEKCNKYFICNHGKPITQRCPAGLLYNPFKEQCDWPHNVDCGDRIIPDGNNNGDNENNGNGDNGNGGGDNGGSDNGGSENDSQNVGDCNCNPNEAPEICAADGSNNVLVAHEKCNKFYVCNNGIPITKLCPTGLLYNPFKEQCDWPHNVNCGDRLIPDGDNSGDTENNNESNENGDNSNDGSDNGGSDNGGSDNDSQNVGECNCNPNEAPEICAADGSNNVLVAHEKCNKFYVCNNGVPITQRCPSGLLYNPFKEQCDWPHNVNCGDRLIPDGENNGDGNNNGNGDNDNGDNDNDHQVIGGGNCDPSQAPQICSAEDSDNVLVAHEKCNKYYICVNGVPVSRPCYTGLFFNPHTDQCDWPENVECGDRVIPDGNTGDSESNGNGGSDNGGSDNGGSDSDNQNGGQCNCNPNEAPELCAADESNGVLVAHEKCNKFFVCSNGLPITQRCPAGLLYNPIIERCDWPEKVNCGDRIIPDGENEDSGGNDNSGDDSGSIDSDGNNNGGGNPGTCNCDSSQAPQICAAERSDNVFVAHGKCNKYYVCANGKPVTFRCPSNLLYNPYIEQCDWPENVKCTDKVVPEVEDNDANDEEVGAVGGGNSDPSQAPIICAEEKATGVFIAHEICTKFYTCNNGKPVALRCPANLFFSPATDQCDWPHLVDCGSRVIPSNFDVSFNKHVDARRQLMRSLM